MGKIKLTGWLIYETYSSKPNHVGMYIGGGQWAHGNYNGGYVKVVTKNYGTFVSYAKPYYRSKIIYNTKLLHRSIRLLLLPLHNHRYHQ